VFESLALSGRIGNFEILMKFKVESSPDNLPLMTADLHLKRDTILNAMFGLTSFLSFYYESR